MAEENQSINSGDRRTSTTSLLSTVRYTHSPYKMMEVVQGLEYIHSEGVVHGDLRGVLYLVHHVF